jgi:hypothetical protein
MPLPERAHEAAGALLTLQALRHPEYLASVEAGSRRAALAPHAVVGAVSRHLRRSFLERRMLASFGCEPDVAAQAFGDTAAVAVTLPPSQAHRQASLLSLLARAASYAQRLAAVAPHSLAYRGALATGRFELTPSGAGRKTFDGAPVREAGALFDRVRGALVCLAPSALDTRLGTAIPDGWDELACPAIVPLEDGAGTETLALSPYFGVSPAERGAIREGLLAGTEGPGREATARFLDALELRFPTGRRSRLVPDVHWPGRRNEAPAPP